MKYSTPIGYGYKYLRLDDGDSESYRGYYTLYQFIPKDKIKADTTYKVTAYLKNNIYTITDFEFAFYCYPNANSPASEYYNYYSGREYLGTTAIKTGYIYVKNASQRDVQFSIRIFQAGKGGCVDVDYVTVEETIVAKYGFRYPRQEGDPAHGYTSSNESGYYGMIKPSNYSIGSLSKKVKDFYVAWRNRYMKMMMRNGLYCSYVDQPMEYSTDWDGNDKPKDRYVSLSTSEATGYGMIIAVIMEDLGAFNRLVNTYNLSRSIENSQFMSWVVPNDEDYANGVMSDSATDGDMDIAYALIMAYEKWGSNTYLDKAKRIINAIKGTGGLIRAKNAKLYLSIGDWTDAGDTSTRISDWMTGHLSIFAEVDNTLPPLDPVWMRLRSTMYNNLSRMSVASSAGLLPDFAYAPDGKDYLEPVLIENNFYYWKNGQWNLGEEKCFMESPYDRYYNYNSCRFPMRFTVDVAQAGFRDGKFLVDERVLNALKKIVGFMRYKYSQGIEKMNAGFKLNGAELYTFLDEEGKISNSYDRGNPCFIAPIIAAAKVDPQFQDLLNAGTSFLLNKGIVGDYFNDTLNLLCLLIISENWWQP